MSHVTNQAPTNPTTNPVNRLEMANQKEIAFDDRESDSRLHRCERLEASGGSVTVSSDLQTSVTVYDHFSDCVRS